MDSKVAAVETPGQQNLQQIQEQIDEGLTRLRKTSRHLMLLYVGAWASAYDIACNLVTAGRRLVDKAEARGERMEDGAVKRFRRLEEGTLEQLREIKGDARLNEVRTSLDETFEHTQDELVTRIQTVLDGMGVPSREQLERLNRDIDLLNEKIDREIARRAVPA